jgi:hypothetical protein
MTRVTLYICALVGFGLIAAGYWLAGIPSVSLIIAVFGLTWSIAQWRQWVWSNPLAMFIGGLSNGYGAWLQFSPVLLMTSMVFMLLTWNLGNFCEILEKASPEDNIALIERRYLTNVGGFLILVILVSLGALTVNFRTSFIQAVLLVILGTIGVMQLVRWVAKEMQNS